MKQPSLNSFIEVLSAKPSVSENTSYKFFRKYGKSIFQNEDLLKELVKLSWSEKNFRKLIRLAGIISSDIRRAFYKEKYYFQNILSIYIQLKEYMYSSSFIRNRGIPYKEWEDLAKDEFELFKILYKNKTLINFEKDIHYKKFRKKYEKKLNDLIMKGYIELECSDGL